MPTSSSPCQKKGHPVPIMFAVTSSWLVPLAVTLYSLCLHSNPRRLYEIQIVHDGLRASEMKELHKAISGHPHISIHFATLPEKLFQSLQNRDCGRFSSLSYVRLLAAGLFPQYDRLLYLDADILLNGDVAELYDTELQGKPIAAVRDCAVLQSICTGRLAPHLECVAGTGVTFPLLYCNTGVMVMDLRQMRQKDMENTLFRILRSRPDSFPYGDQDILNIAFHGSMMPLPVEWNYHFQFELHHKGMRNAGPHHRNRIRESACPVQQPFMEAVPSGRRLQALAPAGHGKDLPPPLPLPLVAGRPATRGRGRGGGKSFPCPAGARACSRRPDGTASMNGC